MIEGLRQLAKYAKDFITKYSAELIAGSVLLAASGTVATLEANDKNKKAIELANDAIDKYQVCRYVKQK